MHESVYVFENMPTQSSWTKNYVTTIRPRVYYLNFVGTTFFLVMGEWVIFIKFETPNL